MTVLMVVELVGAVHLDVRQIEPPVSIDSAGDKLVAVDEDELAGVKPHGPPACRPDNVFVSNVDPDPGHLPEIVDNHTALLRDRSGVDTHRHVYRKPRPRSTHGCLPPGPTVLRSLEHSTGPCWAHLANHGETSGWGLFSAFADIIPENASAEERFKS